MKKGFRLEFILLVLIIALAAFLRFYKLSEYMTFLGDEGRDVLMVKRILTTLDIPLIGPPMSVGNIYLGPLYYYMMTIPMAVFWLNGCCWYGSANWYSHRRISLFLNPGMVWENSCFRCGLLICSINSKYYLLKIFLEPQSCSFFYTAFFYRYLFKS